MLLDLVGLGLDICSTQLSDSSQLIQEIGHHPVESQMVICKVSIYKKYFADHNYKFQSRKKNSSNSKVDKPSNVGIYIYIYTLYLYNPWN